jgi:hypothetical protein
MRSLVAAARLMAASGGHGGVTAGRASEGSAVSTIVMFRDGNRMLAIIGHELTSTMARGSG